MPSLLALLVGCAVASPAPTVTPTVTTLEEGLELIEAVGTPKAAIGDSSITVLRVDPARFDVVVLFAGEGEWRTAKEWALAHDLVATTNPGMFEPAGATTFHAKTATHVSHEAESSKAGSMIVADPVGAGLPGAQVLDTRCEDWGALGPRYRTHVQSYRLLNCDGTPAWQPSTRQWSHALVGEDDAGRILFVHSRSAWSTREFTEVLRALPLGIVRLHYGEGGPEATLYVRPVDREWVGSYETGFHEADDNVRAWDLPNIVGIRRRAP